MLAALAVLALSSLSRSAHAQSADPDPWWGPDKANHFGASALLAAGGYTAGAAAFDARYEALLTGAVVALGAGIGKELLDAAGYGTASWRDLTWDVIGTAAGLATAWGLDLAVRGTPEQRPALMHPRGLQAQLHLSF